MQYTQPAVYAADGKSQEDKTPESILLYELLYRQVEFNDSGPLFYSSPPQTNKRIRTTTITCWQENPAVIQQ